LALVSDFFTTAKLPKGLNLAIVTLLPKTKFPTQFSDYRPISLTHGLYKVVAKILSNRLKHVIRDLISDSQTFFITGCRIVDVLMIANEMVQICRALVCLQQKL
jgi:mannosylglycoprotein endo-beta-mannosidase